MIPQWLHFLMSLSIGSGLASGLVLAFAVWRRPGKMAIMNWVWPLVGLFGGPLAIWLHRRHGAYAYGQAPFPLMVSVAACHCGAGCSLGDLIAESLILVAPPVLYWFGLATLWNEPIFAGWTLDFVLAFLLGIAFQYFSIAPMRGLGPRDGIVAALKADTLSLVAWQAGMYGVMAIVQFGIGRTTADSVEFWFAMQVAMLAGFAVSYPVNWWLLKAGIKEKM
ncbi:MAG: hypothetical protein BGN85_13020 [Alphaproteobacteria bacterium 64-11]|nr:DUF4396 domain-containing protein [Alphaproteobacteria bacterium]OJU09570.1 MAG: hypothetical protein BGN85_13020 [Alphaproteobacteria bacterium 64-11]